MNKEEKTLPPVTDNYTVFEFGYDSKLVVPQEDGIKIIQGLKQAMLYKEQYNNQDTNIVSITPLDLANFKIYMISKDMYDQARFSALLDNK